ncbi:MAG: 3-hydroxyacyl-CoA dehydrogenase NAD-binding domain-containing protein [Pseudomonadota bacterium]
MASLEHWGAERDDDNRLWLTLDKADSGANVLSGPVLKELDHLLDQAYTNPPKALLVQSAKKSGFIMGADINEFTVLKHEQEAYELVRLGQQVLDRLEQAAFPTVAIVDGFALGGGLELAMACHYRVAVDTDKKVIGLPEVKLGIHPGFGGTVRAVRLAGVAEAMPLMLTGKSITPKKAQRIGLVDRVCNRDEADSVALQIAAARPARRRAPVLQRLMNLAPLRGLVANKMVAQTRAKARPDHYPAPFAIIDLWRAHGANVRTGYEAEARSIARLMVGPTAQNLVRVFFLQNGLKGQGKRPKERIERVHVVGAGVMGGDIAAWCAQQGMQVSLQDRELKYISPALERAEKLFERKSKGNAKKLSDMKARLVADVDGDAVAEADLVIEAIFENLEAKQSLYDALVPKMKPGAILATNTSSIPLETLRERLPEPQRFIGLHFFNPVALMPLVEVIRSADTSEEAIDIGTAFVKTIGKLPLVCGSAPGFVVNRILAPYMGEAFRLAESGVALREIDEAAVEFGMPMGPIELADSVGLDVGLSVAQILGGSAEDTAELANMVKAGKLGRKSGQGFYEWQDGKPIKPETRGTAAPTDLTDRLILPMVNEAVHCRAEGVVGDDDLLDAGVIFGTGFAPFRGGPLHYCRERGVSEVRRTLEGLADSLDERFRPDSDAWDQFAARED